MEPMALVPQDPHRHRDASPLAAPRARATPAAAVVGWSRGQQLTERRKRRGLRSTRWRLGQGQGGRRPELREEEGGRPEVEDKAGRRRRRAGEVWSEVEDEAIHGRRRAGEPREEVEDEAGRGRRRMGEAWPEVEDEASRGRRAGVARRLAAGGKQEEGGWICGRGAIGEMGVAADLREGEGGVGGGRRDRGREREE
ncbi:uncharacterized protein LOC101768347 [Setaria italica]|uniref:uncharacterized protein LOC101768347 n=1 Tax=Setaria italica TaxID=4555 RepID=UPI00035085C3|nr:uncharacterized protein LOC101768347 [Setaria italica]